MLISLKDAISKCSKRYFTGIPCKRGHICERYVNGKNCVECIQQIGKGWREYNPERVIARTKEYYAKTSEYKSEYSKRYRKANPQKKAQEVANRNAAKLQRTPVWADQQKIQYFYTESNRITEITGIKYHVDHIIPLQGKLVSGLHVPENLQVITKRDNLRKNNSFNPNGISI